MPLLNVWCIFTENVIAAEDLNGGSEEVTIVDGELSHPGPVTDGGMFCLLCRVLLLFLCFVRH